jgi:hypothetical protein
VPVYTPPDRPYPSLDPIADAQRAYEWAAEFFAVRAPAIRFVGDVIRSGISRIG